MKARGKGLYKAKNREGKLKEITNAQKNYLNIMNALWDFFTSKTGAFIIGVGAIVIGMYQFYISKPILKYEAEHTNIVSSTDVTDLKVTVREKEYKDMYLTTLTLMNTGSQALDGDDVSKVGHDPIRIVVPKDARLVSYNINKKQTSPAVAASLEPYDGDILIRFDYLNPDNQITVSLLHEKTATTSRLSAAPSMSTPSAGPGRRFRCANLSLRFWSSALRPMFWPVFSDAVPKKTLQ